VLVVRRDRLPGDLLDRAGKLDASRSAAHDAECQFRATRRLAALLFRGLEGKQDAAAKFDRILETLESWRMWLSRRPK
jgi:hypothetical protein